MKIKEFLFGHYIWKKESDGHKYKLTIDVQLGAVIFLILVIGVAIWLFK
ncbi:hypothetical protein [Lactobacillus gigeriorum]|nr:hypothetical protein [Lactobacillus gigeriorum]